jgi:predicted RNase H-like nuclease (RuvC/YqgF family)
METILNRIGQLADNEGIKISQLERKIGASKGVLSRAIAKNTDIQAKWLQIIVENYPKYSCEWLLSGKGDMLIDKKQNFEQKSNEDELKAKDNKLNSLENRIRELQLIIDSQKETIETQKELIKLLKSQSKMQNVCVQKSTNSD